MPFLFFRPHSRCTLIVLCDEEAPLVGLFLPIHRGGFQ